MATNKKPNSQQQKLQGYCIFCQGRGMTKQHVWPNWISRTELIDSSRPSSYNQYLTGLSRRHDLVADTKSDTHTTKIIARQGTPLARKVRIVCRTCNNGWMSRIENDSKPIIMGLQAHEPLLLTTADQLKLAAWIAQMTIEAV